MTDEKKKPGRLHWPTAVVLLLLVAGNVLIALLAPAGEALPLIAAYSLTVGTVLTFMRAVLGTSALALLGAIAIGGLAGGCEGPPSFARRAVEVATVVVMDADRLEAERYETAAEQALAASTTLAEYRAAMHPHDALELALRVAQSTVLAADAALDTWREGGAARWPAMAACLIVALNDVRHALGAVGLPTPPELESVLGMVSGFALVACPAAGGAS